MRKLLLTTTALAVTAGAAAAEVTLSGAAKMGVAGSKDDSTRFHTDVNVTFTMSGETDGGLTFGTSVDLSEVSNDNGAKPPKNADGHVVDAATSQDDHHGGIGIFLKGPFGNLNLGDTDGGFDWAMQEVGIGGSLRDNHEHGGFSGNAGLDGMHDGQILRYDHSVGAFGFAVSLELDDDTDGNPGESAGGKGDTVLGLGTTYEMAMPDGGSVKIGLGYQKGAKYHARLNGLAQNNLLFRGVNAAGAAFSTASVSPAYGKVAADYYADASFAAQNADTIGNVKDDVTAIGGSVGFSSANGMQAILNYSRKEHEAVGVTAATGADANNDITARKDVEVSHLGLGVGYTFGQTTIGVNWGSMDTETRFDPNTAAEDADGNSLRRLTNDTTGVGLSVTHDLGGGASLQFGVGSSETDASFTDVDTTADSDRNTETKKASSWSFGLAFSF